VLIVFQEVSMLELVTLRARPDLRPQVFSDRIKDSWPEFMRQDPVGDLYFADAALNAYLDTAFAIIDPADPANAVGRAFAVPFCFGQSPHRMECAVSRWTDVIRWAYTDRVRGRRLNAVSALEITILPLYRGRGA